jgi:hypothetical protein
MAVQLTCPSCQSAVTADETASGTAVRCGGCGARVPVPPIPVGPPPPPAVELPPPPPVEPVTPVTPLTVKSVPFEEDVKPLVAKALPLPTAAGLPVAKAMPLTGKPVAKAVPRDDRWADDDRRSRRRRRDDDDRPRREPEAKGGGGVMIAFLCIGVFLIVGLAGSAFLLLKNGWGQTASTSPGTGGTTWNDPPPVLPNKVPPKVNGDFDPARRFGDPQRPANAAAGWREFKGGGFSVRTPADMTKVGVAFQFGGRPFTGDKYEADPGDALSVRVLELTLPAGAVVTNEEFVARATASGEEKVKKTGGRPMAHGNGVEFTTETGGKPGAALVTTAGGKVYLFHVVWSAANADGPAKRDEVFASARIETKAGANDVAGGGQPRPNPRAGRIPPVNPFDPQPAGPEPIAAAWKTFDGKAGFTADVPPGVKQERHALELEGGQILGGAKYTVEDDVVAYWMFHHDLPAGDADLRKIAGKLVHDVFPHEVNGSEESKVDGKPATKWAIRHFHGGMTSGYSVKVGYRLFTFFVTSKRGINRGGDATMDERQAKFLTSIKVGFDPKTHDPYAGEPEWVPMAKTVGFAVAVPKQATTDAEHRFFHDFQSVPGRAWKTETDGIVFEVFTQQYPARQKNEPEKKLSDVVKWFTDRERLGEGPLKAKLSGFDAEEYHLKSGSRLAHLRVTQVGRVAFALKATPSWGWDKRAGDRELADKAKKFFDSFKVGGTVPNAPAVDAKPAAGEAGVVGGAGGDFVALSGGKVRPFWTAAVLAEKNELLTFGVKDATGSPPGGVLRRYSLPDGKLLATYRLPYPVHRVAIDERRGKVYAATVTSTSDVRAMPEREAAIVAGDIQVYDLRAITSGKLEELEELKPAAAPFFAGGQVCGLHVSPTGDTLYVGGVVSGGVGAKKWFKGKLLKYDTAGERRPASELSFDAPVWATDMSWDGRRLAVVERPTDATGGPKGGGTVVLVDAVNWKRLKATPLTGIPWDATFLKDSLAVVEHDAGVAKLTVVDEAGDTAQIDLPGDTRYVEATTDGKRLLTSAGGMTGMTPNLGLTLYAVETMKPLKLLNKATGVDLGGVPLGGLFTLTGDGKTVVTNTGAMIDVDKSAGK